MVSVVAGRCLLLRLEELAEEGLRGEAEAVGNLLDCEARGDELCLGFAHDVVGDDLLWRLADDSARHF